MTDRDQARPGVGPGQRSRRAGPVCPVGPDAALECFPKRSPDDGIMEASRLERTDAMTETVARDTSPARRGAARLPGRGVEEQSTLGRYQVEREIGKGGMGIVYLGKDPKAGRVVAIKTMALPPECGVDELREVKERIFGEAETAGRLAHPNIVTIHDAGEDRDLAYIAMEFLTGGDLARHAKPDALLPLPKVLSILARVAVALAYAHRNSVVHRDIKPANIMYEPESDTVKITDFGIARTAESPPAKTGMMLGTPSYLSPEQLAGRKAEGRSDLFSLGAALYQLACGRLPFEGGSMAQLMFNIANESHADIRTHDSRLPACVAAVVNKALAKDPNQRYQDGEQMAGALRWCLRSVTAGAVGAAEPATAAFSS